MTVIPSFIAPLFLIAALIAITAGVLFFIRFQTNLTGWAGVFSLAIAFDLVCYYMVLTSTSPSSILFWFRILIVAYLFLSITWLFFVILFTGRVQWISLRTIIVIGAIPILLAGILLMTLPKMDPVWMNTIGSVTGWARACGLYGYLFALYIFSIEFVSVGLLIQMISNNHSYFRNMALFLCVGTVMVILAGFLEFGGSNPFAPVSIVQLFKIVHSLMAFIGVFIYRGGRFLPVARDIAFKNIQDGLLVLDRNDNIVDLNPAAMRILGQPDNKMIGKPISLVWKQGADLLAGNSDGNTIEGEHSLLMNGIEQTFDIVISPVAGVDQERTGWAIVLRNVTGRERMEKALQEHTHELTRTNKLIAALSSIAARLSNIQDLDLGFDILGTEMRKLGLECGIIAIDPVGVTATIKYLSFNPALLQKVQKITGISVKGYVIPRQYWPGDRGLKEKKPVWYPNPSEYIRRMFPQLSDGIVIQSLRLLGIQSESQICILPLSFQDKVIGVMPIWGGDLHPADNPVLELFASQVANIMQSMSIRDNEKKRASELARSNAMILALSKIATLLGNSSNSEFVLDTLGSEIRGLGLDCGIVTLDPDGKATRIKYLSFNAAAIKAVERLAGVSAKNYVIPKRYWPDDRAIKEKVPVWYSDPSDILRGMFPLIPESVARKALQLLGFKPEIQLCMLPLISRENTIGAMLIWGVDLRQSDSSVLAVFASQVAGILQTTSAYETEVERADELARSNSMILALSKVAATLDSSSDAAEIFDTVGKELKKLGLDSIIGILDDNKQIMRIKYISVNQDVIHWAEKMTGHSMDELAIPRHLWPTEVVVNEGVAYWDPNLMKGTLNMFPILPENLHKIAMKMAGLNMNDPVCYLPLANEHEVIGVLAVWGSDLRQTDASALSVLASQLTTAIRNSQRYEAESQRAVELGILLEASEATSSSSQLSEVLLSLASKLLELSSFESCYISEWDRETNMITGLIERSRVYWSRERRDSYSLNDYPSTRGVLLTGNPIVLQGDFQAEEKQWMDELGRTALIILALKAREKTIGLVEIATTKEDQLFAPRVLLECRKILENTADSLIDPLSENSPEDLFVIENALLKASGGEICSFSEWDKPHDCILTLAVSVNVVWTGQNVKRPEEDTAWKMALYEGKTSFLVRPEEDQSITTGKDSSGKLDVESTIIFPLQMGNENIGLIELYDFNHKRNITPAQLTLLRTVADKASYSIQNARLLQQAQTQLTEKTTLLGEKEVLLKEVHHRVKNNLQVISSLLNLQSAKISDLEAKDILRESQNRVRTMALIHEKLYQSSDLAQVDFASYLRSLVNFLSQSYRGKSDNVSIQVEAENILLDIDTAIPCGLIVNELVSNSLKYAFPDNRHGQIKLICQHAAEGRYVLTVSDDGVGLPPGFDISKTPSLGHKLVISLANQLDGKLEIDDEQGTTFRILFERMSNVKGQHINR